MTSVSVITGGAGGMGLATAKVVGRDHTLVLCDVRQDRLDEAARTLAGLGITATAVNCDVTDRKAVDGLLETASALGAIASVIHTAGVSPTMGSAEYIMRTNAVGTVNVNEAFFARRGRGRRDRQRGVDGGTHVAREHDSHSAVPAGAARRGCLHGGHAGGVQCRPATRCSPGSPMR